MKIVSISNRGIIYIGDLADGTTIPINNRVSIRKTKSGYELIQSTDYFEENEEPVEMVWNDIHLKGKKINITYKISGTVYKGSLDVINKYIKDTYDTKIEISDYNGQEIANMYVIEIKNDNGQVIKASIGVFGITIPINSVLSIKIINPTTFDLLYTLSDVYYDSETVNFPANPLIDGIIIRRCNSVKELSKALKDFNKIKLIRWGV